MKELLSKIGHWVMVFIIGVVLVIGCYYVCVDFINDPLGLEEEEEDSTYIDHFVDKLFE